MSPSEFPNRSENAKNEIFRKNYIDIEIQKFSQLFFSVEKNNFVISKKIFLEKFQIPLRISIFHQ